ncbi:MAG TPA: hypothetical protein VG245_01200 [Candidatus Dormibacteraeota bacterium]|jgi:chromosome segregation ATPase|nr:hypothetical protein [Candidatus Dormibacteraeota bacterium]
MAPDGDEQLTALREAFAQTRKLNATESALELLDVSDFQTRLARLREQNQRAIDDAPAHWSRKVSEIQEAVSKQRVQMEDALLEGMLSEEEAMLVRLEEMERNIRNMIRLYRQLVDERNSMVSGIERLHSWIRQLETKQKKKPHRDHGREVLSQRFFIEHLSKQAWVFDNAAGWDLEEPPGKRRA